MKRNHTYSLPWLVVALLLTASESMAQQILLDEPVRAGELILFPDLNDKQKFFYVPDKVRLASDENGRPQFSFLRYVENVRSGADQPEAREGEGGGIVHALVSLSVLEEQIRDAQRELQRIMPGAKIQGPVVFKSGKFSLVSAFKDTQGNLSKQVVGLGNAPLLDGEKAAVSLQLTKLGAKILWESFKTPTPDISFSFEMDLAGFHSPKRAVIDADFDQIYRHEAFSAGVASRYLAGEIKIAFDDLRRKGAIKLTQVGEDEKLEGLITTAYNKIAEMMFSPLNGTGTPSLSNLTAGGSQGSLLDRATRMYQQNQQRTDRENERIRRENRAAAERERTASATGGSGTPTTPTTSRPGATDSRASAGRGTTTSSRPDRSVPLHARQRGVEAPARVRDEDAARERQGRQEEVSAPAFAIVAAYEMKRVRQRGIFHIDLNKYTADTMTLRFDENIGDLRSLMGDAGHFHEVNLDDPLYKQRELVVMIDGLNAQDFGQYINFVTVQMKKTHAGGQLTDDEVRIDRGNFNKEGNAFKLLYGWKGDNDRRKWMNYQYRTVWSFFGGTEVEEDWKKSSDAAINLAPPFQRRTVEFQADPTLVADAGIRLINVKLYYKLGGEEKVKQVTLNPSDAKLSAQVEFILPADELDYEYEVTWRLKGNKTVKSSRMKGSDSILFVDELPNG